MSYARTRTQIRWETKMVAEEEGGVKKKRGGNINLKKKKHTFTHEKLRAAFVLLQRCVMRGFPTMHMGYSSI